jgi:hypothetical protein
LIFNFLYVEVNTAYDIALLEIAGKSFVARGIRFILGPTQVEILECAMKMNGLNSRILRWGWLPGLIVCLSLSLTCIEAQRAGDPAKAQMQEMDRREMQLNNLGEKARANDPKRAQAMMDQVSEDFDRILTLHNEIVRAVSANTPLSDQFISDATAEIKKRSIRLQTTLKLPKPETKPDNRAIEADLKTLMSKEQLILLCKQIESFVRNPIIEKPGTVDVRQLQKAREDLQRVVELSDAIKKQVGKQNP